MMLLHDSLPMPWSRWVTTVTLETLRTKPQNKVLQTFFSDKVGYFVSLKRFFSLNASYFHLCNCLTMCDCSSRYQCMEHKVQTEPQATELDLKQSVLVIYWVSSCHTAQVTLSLGINQMPDSPQHLTPDNCMGNCTLDIYGNFYDLRTYLCTLLIYITGFCLHLTAPTSVQRLSHE